MAIVKMSKFNLAIFRNEKEAILRELQKFEQVHLHNIASEAEWLDLGVRAEDTGVFHQEVNQDLAKAETVIDILQAYVKKEKSFIEKVSNELPKISLQESVSRLQSSDIQALIREVQGLDGKVRELQEKNKVLDDRLSEYRHWEKLDIPLNDLKKIKGLNVRLGLLPKRWADEFRRFVGAETEGTYVEFISSDGNDQYILLIDNGVDENLPQVLRDSNFVPIKLDSDTTVDDQIEAFNVEKEEHKQEIKALKAKLKELAESRLDDLRLYYDVVKNSEMLVEARDKTLESDYLSFVEGYIRTDEVDQFSALIDATSESKVYDLMVVDADEEDPNVPIILENGKLTTPFESIVETYSMPAYHEVDPTPLLAPWYAIYFGMMLGDLGYGLILLVATTLLLSLARFKDSTRKMLEFLRLVSIPTIISGLIFGSLFAGLIPMPYLIDPTQSYMEMLGISVGIGFINIIFALGILAYKHLRKKNAWYAMIDVGFWYLILFGLAAFAAGMFVESLPSIVQTAGIVAAVIGMIGVLLFSEKEASGFGKYAWGLYNLYGMTSYIGDLVSYTRIAALMLSSAYIGYAGNLITGMLFDAGIAGIVGGILVLVIFHLFNLFLGALSGYVHSLRLIYVEFFGKFYEGGGVPFQGLRPDPIYYDIQTKDKTEKLTTIETN